MEGSTIGLVKGATRTLDCKPYGCMVFLKEVKLLA